MRRQQHDTAEIQKRIEQLRAELRAVYAKAKAQNREFTPEEAKHVEKLSDEISQELNLTLGF
jgi:peptidoglycan hydrolase CwlO-like protein